MLLKVTITCSCGCKYELLSNSSHKAVICPNCSKQFVESDKLVEILKLFDSMGLETDSTFISDKIDIVTISEYETYKSE